MIEFTAAARRELGVIGRHDHESEVQTHAEWYDTRPHLRLLSLRDAVKEAQRIEARHKKFCLKFAPGRNQDGKTLTNTLIVACK
jgi:hypothetical protein